MSGHVLVNDVPVTKPGQLVDTEADIRIRGEEHPFVGRGGVKLSHAIKEFGIDVRGRICMDVGASTGGFTDCLLQNGAEKIYAIDVGYGQLDWKIRSDPKVVVMERTNIRELSSLPEDISLAVIDVSFISLTKVFPHIDVLLKKGGDIVALIKPQFEAGKDKVGKGGIVRDDDVRKECIDNVCGSAERLGWTRKGLTTSPITGADGNVEFLAWFLK